MSPLPSAAPRVIVVTRPTEYEALLVRHGTREQARFVLTTYGQAIEDIEVRHHKVMTVVEQVSRAIPAQWRRCQLTRGDLSRFLFEPDDIVVAVGQDGLVANVAKYLSGQRVIGINPDPEMYDGVLVPHRVERMGKLLLGAHQGRCEVECRTMAFAKTSDGQHLLALNEIFVGHRSHQSARYRLAWRNKGERHSSSGIIVATGTGATGWARSIARQRAGEMPLPTPRAPELAFFVREAFPSVATGTSVTEGTLGQDDAPHHRGRATTQFGSVTPVLRFVVAIVGAAGGRTAEGLWQVRPAGRPSSGARANDGRQQHQECALAARARFEIGTASVKANGGRGDAQVGSYFLLS